MTWQETWLQFYPGWPVALLERFAVPIQIDMIKLTGEDPMGWQPWWQSVISPPAQANYTKNLDLNTEQNFGFNLLSPQNPRYATTARWDISFWYATQYSLGWFGGGAPGSIQTNMNFNMHYEGRVWVNLHVFIGYDTRLYQGNFQWNYATQGNLVGSHQVFNGMWSENFADYSSYLIVAPNASAMPYNGADTILALHENGVDNGAVDYSALADFIDYRNAYQKYGAQIAAEQNAAKQQQENEMYAYQSELADKLQAEKNSLQNLQLTMKQAMANETASAARDMAQTFLAAQNLKLSLLQALK